jgi:hypothetical protein
MDGVRALALAVNGRVLSERQLAAVEGRFAPIAREVNGQNGSAATILSAWAADQEDGQDILQKVFALDITQPPASRFRLLSAQDVKQLPPMRALIDGMLYEETLTALYGPEATFKSFVALDWHLCIATGLPWVGRAVKQGASAYISAEGSRGLGKRIAAWEQAHDREAPAHCHFLTDAPQFLEDRDVDDLLDTLEGVNAPLELVTIDTVARTSVGGDENSSRDMGRYVAAADRIKRALRCTVNLIHHATRAGGNIRGSTSLPAALDTEVRAQREGDQLILTCQKQKDAEEFLPITFSKEVVQLTGGGSSVVLRPSSGLEEMTALERRAGEILADSFGPEGATDSQWRMVCDSHGLSQASYYRSKKRLVEQGLVAPESDKRGARFQLTTKWKGDSHAIS